MKYKSSRPHGEPWLKFRTRLLKRIESRASDPRPVGSIKLAGQDAYRVRVGDYRIIYSILDDRILIIIVDVGHRREIYRGL